MNKPQQVFPLGIQRFLELEQRVSDMEKVLSAIGISIQANNDGLQTILDAIERENGKASN